ncbi:uncharacterized protein LOC144923648 [Branchiostoma floridae x Branchiostoma belcheri]
MFLSHQLDIKIPGRTSCCSSQSVISVTVITYITWPGATDSQTTEMSGMGVYVLMIVAMCATWREAEGAVFIANLSPQLTMMYGTRPVPQPRYCPWEGKRMMIGSSWTTIDHCWTCTCSDNGLRCTSPAPYGYPDYCMILTDETCRQHVVDAQDPYSDCDYSNWAITG